ncbi:MAG: PorV/PorQ family protein [Bacteroidota bacterium]
MKTPIHTLGATALLALVVLSMGVPQQAVAQGESAVPFLLIAPTSRFGGVGETGTGWVDDNSAIFYNPGALAFLDGSEISLTHTNWLPQFNLPDLFYDHLNYRQRIDAISGTISASVTYLNLGEFNVTNSSGPDVVDKFKSFEYAITAGYATRVLDELGLGFNLRFIHSALSPIGTEQEQGNGIASTISFDIALMYRPDSNSSDLWRRFSAGLNLSNIGPKITYVDADQADPLPTNLRVGIAYKLLDDEYNSLHLAGDASRLLVRRRDDGSSDEFYEAIATAWGDGSGTGKIIWSAGAEYWYGAPRLIALRLGYFHESARYGNRQFLTFGAGIRYDLYGFDFSYISASSDHPLSDTIRFSLLIAWGGAQM